MSRSITESSPGVSGRKKIGDFAPNAKLNIKDEAIKVAIRADSAHCLIAEAVKQCFPEASYISVDLQTIRFSDLKKRKRYVYLTPRKAQEILVAFDQGQDIEPFSFQLRGGAVHNIGKQKIKPDRASLVFQDGPTSSSGRIPNVIGGPLPPRAALSNVGRRREFGLRRLSK